MDIPRIFKVENRTGGLEYMEEHLMVSVPYFVLLILATVSGTLGNVLIIATVCYTKALRTTGNMFICNLAIADLCITAFVDIFNIISVVEGEVWFIHRPGLCDVVGIICLTSCFCSLYSIGAVSFNRYVHICHHESYNKIFSLRNTIVICVILWIVSFLLELPNIVGWGDHTYDTKTLTCLWDRTHSYSYTLFMAIVGITIPLVVIAICYVKIFLFVRRARLRVLGADDSAPGRGEKGAGIGGKARRDSMKLARTLFIIFVTFAVCWIPYAVVIVADRHDTYAQEVHMFAILLAHVNSSCNSVLYGITNQQFRSGYAHLLGIHRCCPRYFIRTSTTATMGAGGGREGATATGTGVVVLKSTGKGSVGESRA